MHRRRVGEGTHRRRRRARRLQFQRDRLRRSSRVLQPIDPQSARRRAGDRGATSRTADDRRPREIRGQRPRRRQAGARAACRARPGAVEHPAATQVHDFAEMVTTWTEQDGSAAIAPLLIQPVAPADVADVLAEIATGPPQGRCPDLAGPEPQDLVDLARRTRAAGAPRSASYPWSSGLFDLDMAGDVLLPGPGARIAPTTSTTGSPARRSAGMRNIAHEPARRGRPQLPQRQCAQERGNSLTLTPEPGVPRHSRAPHRPCSLPFFPPPPPQSLPPRPPLLPPPSPHPRAQVTDRRCGRCGHRRGPTFRTSATIRCGARSIRARAA